MSCVSRGQGVARAVESLDCHHAPGIEDVAGTDDTETIDTVADDHRIGGKDVLDEFAFVRLARDNRFALDGDVTIVETQFTFPIIFVVPVADVAILGKDRPNIAIELDFVRCAGHGGNGEQ